MEYKKKAHSIYLLTYHIVFVTKYRKPVISNEIGDFIKNHAEYIVGRFAGETLSIETDKDHMHLLVSLPPDVAPSKLVASLKTQTSKEVRLYYREEIKKQCNCSVASNREIFWYKISRHTSKNPIAVGDFKWIFARNCEGTEQLRNNYTEMRFGVIVILLPLQVRL